MPLCMNFIKLVSINKNQQEQVDQPNDMSTVPVTPSKPNDEELGDETPGSEEETPGEDDPVQGGEQDQEQGVVHKSCWCDV